MCPNHFIVLFSRFVISFSLITVSLVWSFLVRSILDFHTIPPKILFSEAWICSHPLVYVHISDEDWFKICLINHHFPFHRYIFVPYQMFYHIINTWTFLYSIIYFILNFFIRIHIYKTERIDGSGWCVSIRGHVMEYMYIPTGSKWELVRFGMHWDQKG